MAHSLSAVVTSVASALRAAAPVPEVVTVPPAALRAGYKPEPAAAALFLAAPAGLSVASTSDTAVYLTWQQVAGAAGYRVESSPNLLTPYRAIGDAASNN